jgi:hypothetical protein
MLLVIVLLHIRRFTSRVAVLWFYVVILLPVLLDSGRSF